MRSIDIHQFPCLKDNYGVLIRDLASGDVAAIDAPDAAAVTRALEEKGWRLSAILNTHHHNDHTAGNLPLKEASGCRVVGPKAEAHRIPGIDIEVSEGDKVMLGATEIRVLDTPGHTLGHVSYWIPSERVAFVGDTLFAMGCGRVLEGNAAMMWASLKKIAALPRDTEIYCGHEYTLANAQFALTIDTGNIALRQRAEEVAGLRAEGKPTLPTRIDKELDTNVFLRASSGAIRDRLGMHAAADWRVFAEIRERKNKA